MTNYCSLKNKIAITAIALVFSSKMAPLRADLKSVTDSYKRDKDNVFILTGVK